MNRLTKTQVLALFLGSSMAIEPIELLNGPGSEDKIPAGQRLAKLSSGTQCNGNADCTVEDEKCGNFQRTGFTPVNICVNSSQKCGAIGRIEGNAFSLECWTDVADGLTASAPAVVEPEAYMTDIEKLITKPTVNWDGIQNMIVSPRYNYQDGWWILESDANKWVENDKPADNRCFLDIQCEPTECCATYPDTNNRRCIAKSLHNKIVSYGPSTFSPICNSQISPNLPIIEPEPVDPWEHVLAEAVEKLVLVKENMLKDAKKKAGYDSMSAEEKQEFDQEEKAKQDKDGEFVIQLQNDIGYFDDDCSNECQATFQQELLKWEKQVYEVCVQNPKGVDCITAQELKIAEEMARIHNDKHYYKNMTNQEREQFDMERKEKVEILKASLTALQREKSQPNPGEEGGSCAEVKCASINHCCGTSTPKQGQQIIEKLENVCGNKIMSRYVNSFGEEYDHVCTQAATKLIAVFAGVATIAISLI